MVRTQIQLTEKQAAALKRMADQQQVSVAELIRQAVERLISSPGHRDAADKQRRALAFIGAFADTADDVSENHDRYLAEIWQSQIESQA